MRVILRTIAALALSCGAVQAAEKPSDFAWSLRIEADGSDDSYQFDLPAAVYRGIARRDAGDLRVFNAAGEVVPHGLQHQTNVQAAKPQARADAIPSKRNSFQRHRRPAGAR